MISVVIPAFRAQKTIARAIRSVIEQSIEDWEAIIVSDDATDYAGFLQHSGIEDPRLRFVSTGRVGSGAPSARNVGRALARGDFIAALDADDLYLPFRLEKLLPTASSFGAAADIFCVIDDITGQEICHALEGNFTQRFLDVSSFLELSVPISPMVAREYAEPYPAGTEFSEDVVANLRLIDCIGSLPIIGESLSEYRVVRGSLCHNDRSAENFEQSYSDLIEILSHGDRLGLSPANAEAAREGFLRKRDLNRAFAAARQNNRTLDFQTFAAARHKSDLLA